MTRATAIPAILLLCLLPLPALAQKPTVYKYKCKRWHIAPANYSGIAPLGEKGLYAVVSDQEQEAGFYMWQIDMDSLSGRLTAIRNLGWRGTAFPIDRDAEGVAWCGPRGTVFVSGEADQRILEHHPDGTLTGHELQVPTHLGAAHIRPNRGFEALTFDAQTELFWTVTESPLPGDPPQQLRLQSFGPDLRPHQEWPYHLSDSTLHATGSRDYYHGVVALAPAGDGRLLVLEREARIARRYSGSRCRCKLFLFTPSSGNKRLLYECLTRFTPFNTRFANFEALCLGPTLADGRRTLILLSDSQAGYGKALWHLQDRLRVLVLPAF